VVRGRAQGEKSSSFGLVALSIYFKLNCRNAAPKGPAFSLTKLE
jgi:hypothetical protein